MAISYEQWKSAYEGMDSKQQADYAKQAAASNGVAKEYAQRYVNENAPQKYTPQQNTEQKPLPQEAEQKPLQQQQVDMTAEEYRKQNQTNVNNSNNVETPKQNQNETFDSSRMTDPNAKVSVKEGTASETGFPDYQNSTKERENEIVNNLNSYYASNKEFFNDRNTFNSVFHYDERNDSQKALLDSFWKGKKTTEEASNYTTGDEVYEGMMNGQITPNVLDAIRTQYNDIYKEYIAKQEEQTKLNLANGITPQVQNNMDMLADIMSQLKIDTQYVHDIRGLANTKIQQLGIYADNDRMNEIAAAMGENAKQIAAINRKYSTSGSGSRGDYYMEAKRQAAISGIQAEQAAYYNQYNALLTKRNQNLAIVQQEVSTEVQQANEEQRVFNDRLTSLGFAMTTANWETNDQAFARQISQQQAMNAVNLQYQEASNKLNLLNAYQTNQLNNVMSRENALYQSQTQFMLTDLNVKDPQQLKSNLYNALTPYFQKYGNIIQRSQSQVVSDILAYAQEKGISVEQALKENFIAPLQNKAEYKQAINTAYGMNVKQTISKGMLITTNPDGTISWVKMDDTAIPGTTQEANINAFKTTWNNTQDWDSYVSSILQNVKEGTYGGQCGAAMNDILQGAGYGRVFGNKLRDKISVCQNKFLDSNADYSKIKAGDFAVIDTGATYTDKNGNKVNAGHVGLITGFDGTYVYVLDSNGQAGKEKWRQSKYKLSDLKGTYSVQGNNSTSSSTNYSTARISMYDKYIADGIKPTDALLKSWGNGDISKGLKKFEAEVEAYKEAAGYTTGYSEEANTEVTKLREAFIKTDAYKNYKNSKNYYDQLLVTSKKETAAGDMAMIFAYMKMLDPGSVVREGEFANAQNAAGLPQRIVNLYNNAVKGTRLSSEQRKDFLSIAEDFLNNSIKEYNRELQKQQSFIKKGGNPNSIGTKLDLVGNTSVNNDWLSVGTDNYSSDDFDEFLASFE